MRSLRLIRLIFAIPLGRLSARSSVSLRELNRIERGLVTPSAQTIALGDW
jgi:hypothetical protein